MSATIEAASISPNARAADMDIAATISSPNSPRHKLLRISTSKVASTGRVAIAQISRAP